MLQTDLADKEKRVNTCRTKKFIAAAAITLLAGSAQALVCGGPSGTRTLTVNPAIACGPTGLGNLQNADITSLYPTASIIERDAADSNGGTLNITGQGGSSGTWSFLGSVMSSYSTVYLGFHLGGGGNTSASNPDWFIVQVGANSGTWSQNATQWTLSNIVLFGTGPTSTSSGNAPEPGTASLALLGLGLLGAGFVLRRRKTS